MNISKVEDFIAYNMAKDLMKQVAGDGMEFEIMYQAVLDSMKSNGELTSEGNEDIIHSGETSSTVKLDEMPLLVKGQNNGAVYGRQPVNYTISSKKPIQSLLNSSKESSIGSYEVTSNKTIKDIIDNLDSIKNKYNSATGVDLDKIYSTVEKYSSKYGVDKNLVLAIIKQESNFDPNAVSHAGAMGLMQLMDFNCNSYGISYPLDIEQNIEGGVRHIKEYLNMFDGNVEMALMAYNGGPGTMSRRGVNSKEDLYKMPQETQNYVPKVMDYYRNGFSL